ncbi:HD domain-containing phosphohydrolase [Sulfurimonas sp.]
MLYCDKTYKLQEEKYSILIIKTLGLQNDTLFNELSKYQLEIQRVNDFKKAKLLLKKDDFDFVLLALHFTDKNDELFIAEIQKLTDTKIMILSSKTDIKLRERVFENGVFDFILQDQDSSSLAHSIYNSMYIVQQNRNDTILILDNASSSQYLDFFLKLHNFRVIFVRTKTEALEKLQNSMVNMIIVDVDSHREDGFAFLREIKNTDTFCHIHFLVLSSTNDPDMLRKALKKGASDFIKKPFHTEEFTLKIDLLAQASRNHVESLCLQKYLNEYKEAVDDVSYVTKTDLQGTITYANDLFCELSGYSRKELIGKKHSIIRHPNAPSTLFKDMWQTIQAKKAWKGIIKNRKKNDESYYVKSLIKPILDINGNIVEYIAIRTDITELETYKEILEENLNASNNNLQYLKQYENAMDEYVAVIKTNTDNIITYCNENFSRLSGYISNEIIGKACSDFRTQKHKDRGDCASIPGKLRNKEKVAFLFENIAKDGHLYYVDTKIYPLVGRDGEIKEHLHLMYDVSDIVKIHEELENTQKEIIYTMGEVGESRSKETGNHVKRVAEYSKLLALLAGLDEEEAKLLYTASPMHDIGKVGIPDSVLLKSGKLNSSEWEIMQTHSEIGYNILKNSNRSILKAAAIVSHTHHEKWDGTGYPQELHGINIHIFGRITAIVDVFDALGSDRVYKKSWPLEKIVDLFKEERGKHFDPELVDLFLNNVDKFLAIRDKYKDI